MPRKSPLPKKEREIGRRLKESRAERRISQTAFADALGISRAQLINYEEGISPLPWPVALRLLETFAINPRWLATGKLPKQLHRNAAPPDPDPETTTARTPFSKVYDERWKKTVESETLNLVTFGFRPTQAVDAILEHNIDSAVLGWLQRLPKGRGREFFLELSAEAERIILQFDPSDAGPDRGTGP